MATPDAELAYKTLDLIKANPDAFNMADWFDSRDDEAIELDDLTDGGCGTTACFAGWAIALSGYKLGGGIWRGDEHLGYSYEQFATKLLRLDPDRANYLFYVQDGEIADAVAEVFGPRPGGDL